MLRSLGCGIIVWVIWIAMQTGIPCQPATNVALGSPLVLSTSSSTLPLALAVLATVAWGLAGHERGGRHPASIWKVWYLRLLVWRCVVSWVLLLPQEAKLLLDHARSYGAHDPAITRSFSSECGVWRCWV
ncbi:MAG: hypothetical protein IPO19_13310 [Rhodoferax sp.]|nr:hypothetical protein [Rhodoferax sp.]